MRTSPRITPRHNGPRLTRLLVNAGRGLLLLACGALGFAAGPRAQSTSDAQGGAMLYQRLALASAGTEQRLAIDLSPRGWAVGQPGGRPANEAQLRAVLAQLTGIEIGGRCANDAGNTAARECAVALAPPDFAGIVVKDHRGDISLGWAATASADRSGAARGALANPKQSFDAMRYFGLLAPERFVDTPIAPLGATLALRYRAGAGDPLPAGLDRSSAWLRLRGEGAAPLAQVGLWPQ